MWEAAAARTGMAQESLGGSWVALRVWAVLVDAAGSLEASTGRVEAVVDCMAKEGRSAMVAVAAAEGVLLAAILVVAAVVVVSVASRAADAVASAAVGLVSTPGERAAPVGLGAVEARAGVRVVGPAEGEEATETPVEVG